jgi:hypothetical protein
LALNVTKVEKLPNGTQQFSVVQGNPGPYIWSVNEVDGGNSTFGTITTNGLYTAPAAVPTPATFNVCARRQAAPGEKACASVTIQPVPSGGADVIVFNDVNVFDGTAAQNPNNVKLYKNLVGFTGSGARATKTSLLLSIGHGSQFTTFPGMEAAAQQGGYTVDRLSTALPAAIDAKYKIVVLALPTTSYTVTEINALKAFAAEGGRIIFVGEHSGFYSGITVQNDFLKKMGAVMTNAGGAHDCGYNVLPASRLRPHQVMDGLTDLTMACASEVILGPNDYALFYSLDGTRVLGAVAKVDVTPLSQAMANTMAAEVRARATPATLTTPRSTDPAGRDMPRASRTTRPPK